MVQILNQSKVKYALCGGIAVGVYGHIRATEGIDTVIRSAPDLAIIDTVLQSQGWKNLSESMDFENGFTLHRCVKTNGKVLI